MQMAPSAFWCGTLGRQFAKKTARVKFHYVICCLNNINVEWLNDCALLSVAFIHPLLTFHLQTPSLVYD